ncbi:MAG: TolC family protein [Verrucomicrobiia bacterium]
MKTTHFSRYCAGLIAVTVFGLCTAQSTRADGPTNEVAVAPSNMVADVMAEGQTNVLKAITIRDCIMRALQNNFDIKIQRINPSIQSWGVVFAQGVFDPTLSGSSTFQDNTQPLGPDDAKALGVPSVKQRTWTSQLGLAGKLPTGAQYGFNATDTRTSGTLATNFVFTGSVSASLTQPLLKNFGLGANTAFIRMARKQRDINVQNFINQMITSISSVYNAYYELIFAIEDHKAKSEDLQLAKQLLDENRKKLQIGTMSPLDVVQAESGVASREQAIILAARTIKDNENALKLLISQNVAEFQGESFLPVDYPVAEMVETDVASSTRTALESRPDYVAARHALDKQNIQVKYNSNQLWPEIDLNASYGWNGRGSNFQDWSDNVNSRDNPVWAAGVTVTFPIGNRQARASYQSARLQSEQLLLQLKQLEQQIVVAVDNAVGHVRTNLKSVEAAVAASHLANESLKAEKAKLLAGTSTTFLVLQAQSQLAAARSAEIRARADYAESLVTLTQQEGTTLQKNNIVLDERF